MECGETIVCKAASVQVPRAIIVRSIQPKSLRKPKQIALPYVFRRGAWPTTDVKNFANLLPIRISGLRMVEYGEKSRR